MPTMDEFGTQSPSSDRSRGPPLRRTASRSSTSSSRTRTSNASLTSTPQSSTNSHRSQQSRGNRPPPVERSRSQMSRESSGSVGPAQPTTMSALLLERLEKERCSSRGSNNTTSRSADSRDVQSSPAKRDSAEPRTPGSSGGSGGQKTTRYGLKATEETLSALHKQNFDLKLEVYHRREREKALEERLQKLESEKKETDQINDQLLMELEKRDKAVGEAVEMIVALEARVDQLLRERAMVRKVEEQGLLFSQDETPDLSTPKTKTSKLPKLDQSKNLKPMPSFVSMRTEFTENLRNVYLGTIGSMASLPQGIEDSPGTDHVDMNELQNPSLSILSESSFLSVYGRNRPSSPPDPTNNSLSTPSSVDGAANIGRMSTATRDTPTKTSWIPSPQRAVSSSSQFQNMNDVLDMDRSPLQQLERLDETLTPSKDASKTSNAGSGNDRRLTAAHLAQSQARKLTKEEKRAAIQRVLKQGGHDSKDFSQHHVLPPTPDTISTSTLRHYQTSNDTLAKGDNPPSDRTYVTASETMSSQRSGRGEGNDRLGGLNVPAQASQPASTTAFESRKELAKDDDLFDTPWNLRQLRRPRSADETTLSRCRSRTNFSDSSDDEFQESMDSVSSAYVPWLKPSPHSGRPGPIGPMSSASQTGLNKAGWEGNSPDLFSFPENARGWRTDAIYGSLGGAGYNGAIGTSLSPIPCSESFDYPETMPPPLFSSGLASPAIGANISPPPAPNRRSSLNARTGEYQGGPDSPVRQPTSASSKLKKSPLRTGRTRSNSIDSQPQLSKQPRATDLGFGRYRPQTVPPNQLQIAPPPLTQQVPVGQHQFSVPSKQQRHYPPTSSQASSRPRGLGLNFFRRSTGPSEQQQLTQNQSDMISGGPTPTESTFGKGSAPIIGIPRWVSRNSASFMDADRDSATPPPIQRNKGHDGTMGRLENDMEGGVSLMDSAEVGQAHGSGCCGVAGCGHGGGAPLGAVPSHGSGGHQLPRGARTGSKASMSGSTGSGSLSGGSGYCVVSGNGGGGVAAHQQQQGANAASPTTPVTSKSEKRRSWLPGLGRRNSLKKSGGVAGGGASVSGGQ